MPSRTATPSPSVLGCSTARSGPYGPSSSARRAFWTRSHPTGCTTSAHAMNCPGCPTGTACGKARMHSTSRRRKPGARRGERRLRRSSLRGTEPRPRFGPRFYGYRRDGGEGRPLTLPDHEGSKMAAAHALGSGHVPEGVPSPPGGVKRHVTLRRRGFCRYGGAPRGVAQASPLRTAAGGVLLAVLLCHSHKAARPDWRTAHRDTPSRRHPTATRRQRPSRCPRRRIAPRRRRRAPILRIPHPGREPLRALPVLAGFEQPAQQPVPQHQGAFLSRGRQHVLAVIVRFVHMLAAFGILVSAAGREVGRMPTLACIHVLYPHIGQRLPLVIREVAGGQAV